MSVCIYHLITTITIIIIMYVETHDSIKSKWFNFWNLIMYYRTSINKQKKKTLKLKLKNT